MRITYLKKAIFLNLCVFVVVQSTCFAANAAKKNVKEANTLYQKGKLDEALQKYNEARAALPDSDIINFNMGVALYKKEDYQKAQDAFTRALTSGNKKIEADALYNMGNCKYKLGKLKEDTDLSAAAGLLQEALDYYKRAVEIDQKNTDARFNHEFTERELKILLDKMKQQESAKGKQKSQQGQQQSQQQGQQQSQQQQDQQNQGASPIGKDSPGSARDRQGADKKEKEQSGQAEDQKQLDSAHHPLNRPEPAEGQEKGEAGKEELQQEAVRLPSPQVENKELSEEGARTLLERYGKEEATPDYRIEQTQRDYDSQVLKDW